MQRELLDLPSDILFLILQHLPWSTRIVCKRFVQCIRRDAKLLWHRAYYRKMICELIPHSDMPRLCGCRLFSDKDCNWPSWVFRSCLPSDYRAFFISGIRGMKKMDFLHFIFGIGVSAFI